MRKHKAQVSLWVRANLRLLITCTLFKATIVLLLAIKERRTNSEQVALANKSLSSAITKKSLNSESKIALGGKLQLRDLSPEVLLFIPGISDTLSRAIIKNRQKIITKASNGNESPFEIVKSIGKKRGELLNSYFQMN
jgi:hypothetical protein